MICSHNLHLLDNVHLALAASIYFVRRITCGGRRLQAWRVRNNRAREDKQRQQRENDKDIQMPGGCDRLHCEPVKSLQQQWPLVASYPVPPMISSPFPLHWLSPWAAAECTSPFRESSLSQPLTTRCRVPLTFY